MQPPSNEIPGTAGSGDPNQPPQNTPSQQYPEQPAPGQPYGPQGYAPQGYPPHPGYAPPGYPPPPGQYPYPPSTSRRVPWWAFVVGGCGCLALFVPFLAAILFPVFAQAREKARAASCMSNQKQMALGLLMYSQDYDEMLVGKAHWMNDIEPYCKGGAVAGSPNEYPLFHCPSASQRDDSVFGYAFDSRLDRKAMASIASPRETLMTFDSSTFGKNASDPATSLPNPGRHMRRNCGSFVDGHVVWVGGTTGASNYGQ